jgi:hypothetical protein
MGFTECLVPELISCKSSNQTAAGETLAISIPRSEAAVIKHFQSRMPYWLIVPDVD